VLSAETMSCSTIYQNSKTKGPIHSYSVERTAHLMSTGTQQDMPSGQQV
jgi:hypothetical protein